MKSVKSDSELPAVSAPVSLLAEQLNALADLFPQAFTEGKLDFAKLRALLGDAVDTRPERYSFSWSGKRQAIEHAQTPSQATLLPVRSESVNFDTTNNLFIEGDNLEVLKLLHRSYFNAVKLIYIDPPYNTGNDFVYPDDFSDALDNYLQVTGQKDAQGNLRTSNPETSGRYHSAWLSMMYPRLVLARSLLADDGVILVSIDDNEVHDLVQLMNEIFGEQGHMATFVWRRRIGSSMAQSWISTDHEYVLAYSKHPQDVYVRGDERDMGKYSLRDAQGRLYASMPLTVGMSKSMRPNQWYKLINPRTGTGYWPPENRVWAYIPSTMQEKIREGKILWPEDDPKGNRTTPRLMSYPEDAKRERKPTSTWIAEKNGKDQQADAEAHSLTSAKNEEGTRALKDLIGGEHPFVYPKPVSLLRSLIEQFTQDNDIVLDFFAGSCTTAQVVLELNREDNADRRFIMVQLPEPTGSDQLPTIADIGKERIRRVIARMEEADKGTLKLSSRKTPEDLGFRVFKLGASNLRRWTPPTEDTDEAYLRQLELMATTLAAGSQPEDVLWEVALREGYSLSSQIARVPNVPTNAVYRVTDPSKQQSFYLCLDDRLDLAGLRPLALTRDTLFICRAQSLDDTTGANLALMCRLKTI